MTDPLLSSFPTLFCDVPTASTLTVNPATALTMLRDFKDIKENDVIVQNAANCKFHSSDFDSVAKKNSPTSREEEKLSPCEMTPLYSNCVFEVKDACISIVVIDDKESGLCRSPALDYVLSN